MSLQWDQYISILYKIYMVSHIKLVVQILIHWRKSTKLSERPEKSIWISYPVTLLAVLREPETSVGTQT